MSTLATIIITALTSSGLFSFMQFLINRKDNTAEQLKSINAKLDKLERDSVRTQLLVMLNHYPNEVNEIMKLAHHYFEDLQGNWYMTPIFNKWLEQNNVGKPEWFNN